MIALYISLTIMGIVIVVLLIYALAYLINDYNNTITDLAFIILGAFLLVVISVCTIWGIKATHNELHKKDKKSIIVSTTVPPQVDTAITIHNEVADTTYTYRFDEYDTRGLR